MQTNKQKQNSCIVNIVQRKEFVLHVDDNTFKIGIVHEHVFHTTSSYLFLNRQDTINALMYGNNVIYEGSLTGYRLYFQMPVPEQQFLLFLISFFTAVR